jgi:N-acetylglucosaminyldiphosphoundecaprenol N-acetyl-beta-D-mannosaminyltransferase
VRQLVTPGLVAGPPRTVVLGVPLACLDMDETVAWVERAIASRSSHQVVTANVNFLSLARRSPEFLRLLQDASLVTADGMPLCWASRLLGARIPERVTGADLVPRLAAHAARRGHRLFLMGPPAATPEAARRLRAAHPGLEIAGVETPPYGPIESWDNDAYCARIREARTAILLVGFGAPKQEQWLARHLPRTGAAIGIGVGATFDYIAGQVRRAPVALQAAGLEWAWRIWREPRRLWRRYVSDGSRVGPALLAQLVVTRGARRRAGRAASGGARVARTGPVGAVVVLSLTGHLTADGRAALARALRGFRDVPPALVLDLAAARFLAPTVLGDLVYLVSRVRQAGGRTRLVTSVEMSRQLAAAGLDALAPVAPDVASAVSQLTRDRGRRPVVAA